MQVEVPPVSALDNNLGAQLDVYWESPSAA